MPLEREARGFDPGCRRASQVLALDPTRAQLLAGIRPRQQCPFGDTQDIEFWLCDSARENIETDSLMYRPMRKLTLPRPEVILPLEALRCFVCIELCNFPESRKNVHLDAGKLTSKAWNSESKLR